MLKLLGLLLIAVGFALRWNALLVVMLAGILTGLLAGFSLNEIMAVVGESFIANRYIILPLVLLVPLVGLLERHGLRERLAALITGVPAASPGRVLLLYQGLRELTSTIALSIGNHASTVRPLVVPLAEGALGAAARTPAATAQIRAHAAAAENTGNFFADDLLVAVGALLLIKGTFATVGVEVALVDLQRWCAPTAAWVLVVGWWRYGILDRRLNPPTVPPR